MLHNVGEYGHIIRSRKSEIAEGARIYGKPAVSCDSCSCFIQLTTFDVKSVLCIDLETSPLVATYVQQPSRAGASMKGNIPIEPYPQPIEE
jgi:hypothetical protein